MKLNLAKLVVCAFALAALPIYAADTMPRSEWHALVGDCAQNPQTLKQTIGKLSADDQLAFVQEVNAAISKMPGSNEEKGAAFYNANRAAVSGAGKENLKAVLAEVYATVPVEYLTEINERFAKELFSRTANPAHVPTDPEFIELSTNTMAVVVQRCQNAEDASVRETFAALMLVRASGGTPSDLAQTLVSQFSSAQDRDTILNDWIKPAMGDGQEQSYDNMLAAAQASNDEPDHAVVVQLAGSGQITEALLSDLAAPSDSQTTAANIGAGAFLPPGVPGTSAGENSSTDSTRIPRAYVDSPTAVGGTSAGQNEGSNPYYTGDRGSKPQEGGQGQEPEVEPSHPSLYER